MANHIADPKPNTPVDISSFIRLAIGLLALIAFAAMPAQPFAQLKLKDLLKPNLELQISPNLVVCIAPKIIKNGQCVCPSHMVPVGNSCQNKLQILCVAPMVPQNGKCVCPSGMNKVGNKCLPALQILCQAPFVPNVAGKKCVCPAGTKKLGNTCVPKNLLLCQAPFVPNNAGTKCVCPPGSRKIGNFCAPIAQIWCQAPFVPNASNNACVCPGNLVKSGNLCVKPQSGPSCNWPFVHNRDKTACVCAKGYRLNNSGNRCLRKQSTTVPSVNKAAARRIQECLNLLGYPAGPVDGSPGSRTKNAFNQFRIAQGMTHRPNNIADPVVQDRLYQACQNAQQPTPTPNDNGALQPDDHSDGQSGNSGDGDSSNGPADHGGTPAVITNFSPLTGYPPLQCASADLIDKLKAAFGSGLDIGLCGQSCTPIPPGMTAEQIKVTGINVNWCLTCAKLGNGLLCSANANGG